jgi:FtsZ-binding cell division protein ZapB
VRHHENTIAALRANIENLTNEKNRFSEDLKELRPEYEKLKGTTLQIFGSSQCFGSVSCSGAT